MIYEFKVRRVRRSKASDNIIRVANPQNVADAVRPFIAGEAREHFFTVCIGGKNELLGLEKTAVGNLQGVEVHPREVFRTALLTSAVGIILCHNHPSGDPTPSQEDTELTGRFVQAGEILGIPVYDHVIVTDDDYYSFSEHSRIHNLIMEVTLG